MFTLSGSSSSVSPSDYFGVSSGSSLMAGLPTASGGSAEPFRVTPLASLPSASSFARLDPHYHLGTASTFGIAHERFSVSSATDLMTPLKKASELSFAERFTMAKAPTTESATLTVMADLATKYTPLEPALVALDLGKGLYEIGKAVEQSETAGMSKLEAGICKTANVAADLTITLAGAEALLFGVPATVALGVSNPPVGALVATGVTAALPSATANLLRLGAVAGDLAEDKCHKLFSGSH